VVDGVTNSAAEGFRLEGFDGLPPALKSMDPLLDFGSTGSKSKTAKKAQRVMFQRMSGLEMFMYFVDVHQQPGFATEEQLATHLSATEYVEIAFQHMVAQLILLCLACRQVKVPQKWIGSSVAVGFDVAPESVPKRTPGVEKEIRQGVRVHIFDWGRSELNTIKKFQALNEKQQRDRSKFWTFYVGGVTRLAWDAARVYWHRFCNAQGWQKLYISVVDFDSILADDFIGRVVIEPIKEMEEITVDLTMCGGTRKFEVSGHHKRPCVTFSLRWTSFPESSRLKGVWCVHVKQAQHLPRYDKVLLKTTSDPFVEVTAVSERHVFRQRTSVKVAALSPIWDETLHIPVARGEGAEESMKKIFAGTGVDLENSSLDSILLPEHRLGYAQTSICCKPTKARTQNLSHGGALEDARAQWEDLMDQAPRTSSDGDTEVVKEFWEHIMTARTDVREELRQQEDDKAMEAELAEAIPLEPSVSSRQDDEPTVESISETLPTLPVVKPEKQASDQLCIEEPYCGKEGGCRHCRCQ